MLTALGGTPVAMSYGDIYTSLSTGIIDGTETMKQRLQQVSMVRYVRCIRLMSMP